MIGERIRELREADGILLRELAAELNVDLAMLSKMERGKRSFRRKDIKKLARIFKQSEKNLLTLWLAHKILKTANKEQFAREALELAIKNA